MWADDDEDQGPLHTNFKLSSAGESFFLSTPEGIVTNSVTFDMLESDESFARIPNGIGEFTVKAPSFGFNNELDLALNNLEENEIYLFPNPSQGEFWMEHTNESQFYEVYNSQGQLVSSGNLNKTNAVGTKINVSHLNIGIYILKVASDVNSVSERFIIE